MTTKTLITGITAVALSAAPAFAFAQGVGVSVGVQANASTSVSGSQGSVQGGGSLQLDSSASATGQAMRAQALADRLAKAKDRADQEIDRRIANLTAFEARLSAMKNVSASGQASLQTALQAQINALTTLKATIGTDSATTTLRADIQSIAIGYRIYALVLPQSAILASADRVNTVATQMQQLSAKLSTRIAAVPAGTDVSVAQTALADFNAKIADASVQANAAVTEVASLKPDNGDKTIFATNTQALKDARAKIQAGQKDLQTARQDVTAIIKVIRDTHASVHAGVSASTTVTH